MEDLEEENGEAFIAGPERAKCMLSGPGTGKTYRLVEYTEKLLREGVDPSEIVILAFARTAVREFRDRIITDLELDEEECPEVRTLHSYSLKQILRHNPFSDVPEPLCVADDYEEGKILMEELSSALSWSKRDVKDVMKEYQNAWSSLDADESDWSGERRRGEFMSKLQALRRDYGFVLLGELVYLLKTMLDSHPALRPVVAPGYLVVDEYQDLNRCDQKVIRHMYDAGSRLAVAGDDDQTIYESLRKADPEGIRDFKESYQNGKRYRMTGCHRCPENVLLYANRLILQNQRRVPKVLHSLRTDHEGEVLALEFQDQNDEASGVARICEHLIRQGFEPYEILILLSRRRLGFDQLFLDFLLGRSLPAKFFATKIPFLDNRQVRRSFAMMRFAIQPQDALAIRTWLETTPRLGRISLDHFRRWRMESNLTFIEGIARLADMDTSSASWMVKIDSSFNDLSGHAAELNSIESILEKIDYMASVQTPSEPNLSEFLEELRRMASQDENLDLSGMIGEIREVQVQKDLNLDETSIRVMTMHSAKGLSARAVIIPGLEDFLMPDVEDPLEVEERRRLFYVSVTRCKERLYLSHCTRREGAQRYLGRAGGRSRRRRSRFLEDMRIDSQSGSSFVSNL